MVEVDKIIKLPDNQQLIENRIYYGEFDGGDLIGLYTYFEDGKDLKVWTFYLNPYDPMPQQMIVDRKKISTILRNGSLMLTNFRSAYYGFGKIDNACPLYLKVLGKFFMTTPQDTNTLPSIIMRDDKGVEVEITRDSNSRYLVRRGKSKGVTPRQNVMALLFLNDKMMPYKFLNLEDGGWYRFENPVLIYYDAIYVRKRDNEIVSFGFFQHRDNLQIGEGYLRGFNLIKGGESENIVNGIDFAKQISLGYYERTWYKFNPTTVPNGATPAIYQWLVSFFTDDFDPRTVPRGIQMVENDELCLVKRYKSESATKEVFCMFTPPPESTTHPFYGDKASAITYLLERTYSKSLVEYFDYDSQQWLKTMYFGDDDTVETPQEEPPSEVQQPPQVVEFDKMEAMAKYLQNNTISNDKVNMNDYARQIILNFISAVKSEHDDVSKKTQKVLKKYNNE